MGVNDDWDTPTKREAFANAADRPNTWFVKGCQLKAAADRCDWIGGTGIGDLHWVYTMLLGMAIESLLKAAIVLHHGSQLKREPNRAVNLERSFLIHDLDALAKRIETQDFTLSKDELELLNRLTSFIEWCGRYPVPRGDNDMMAVGTSSIERGRILAFYDRLLNDLRKHKAVLNELSVKRSPAD
ncbi:MAG TPA: hypothetical protein VFG04_13830 [Planctomycetaceae bacterium]|nr:hypothetical protein [Planctomycetaceae bacterium]